MTLYLSQQKLLLMLVSSFALGFLFSALYDLLRFFRKRRKGYVLTSIEDLFFFSFVGVVFSILFYVTNYGKVRPLAFVMAFLGFVLCRHTLSPLTFRLLGLITACLGKVGRWLMRLLSPLGRAVKGFWARLFSPVKKALQKKKPRKKGKKKAGRAPAKKQERLTE